MLAEMNRAAPAQPQLLETNLPSLPILAARSDFFMCSQTEAEKHEAAAKKIQASANVLF